jgi:hypothetical protein
MYHNGAIHKGDANLDALAEAERRSIEDTKRRREMGMVAGK